MSSAPQTLRDILQDTNNLKQTKVTDIVFRATAPKYATKSLLTTLHKASLGSFLNGGRFNRKGHFHVLYLSIDDETCRAEMNKYAARGGIVLKNTSPHTLAIWDLNLTRVLDLTDDELRRKLQIDEDVLLKTDWEILQNFYEIPASTQRLGELARELGFGALLTPSVAHAGGKNLSVFVDNIDGTHQVCTICNPEVYPD